ncbi:MAG: hypothetical protein EOP08_10100 [Proteobacteria bacterium]|nr:MAG: hypothetical protein EOP08_10100 [Pseudomonadota bacterium]
MATPLTQSLQSEFDAINSEYNDHFAGQNRATRELAKLDSLVSRIKSVLARIDAIPAMARGAELDSLRSDIEEQRKLFEAERPQIERAKKLGPVLERFAPLATAANATFARYARHFAGQSRDTRDLDLLDDMIDELTRTEREMGEVISRTPSDDFRNDRKIVQDNLEMYKGEREQIVKTQTSGSPEARAERLASLANNQFENYRQHFAGQNRLTRRPQLLQRMIKSLERAQSQMREVDKSQHGADFNKGNIDIVEQNLAMYRAELAEIRKVKETNSLDDLAGNLGDSANQLFAQYRENFAGKNRTTVDLALLGRICDQLYEIFRQMRDIDRTKKVEMNTKNLEIVTDQLALFGREFDEIVKARQAAGLPASTSGATGGGDASALREQLLAVCAARGVIIPADQRAALANRDATAIQDLLNYVRRTGAWPA